MAADWCKKKQHRASIKTVNLILNFIALPVIFHKLIANEVTINTKK
jgi:hypothetical protein